MGLYHLPCCQRKPSSPPSKCRHEHSWSTRPCGRQCCNGLASPQSCTASSRTSRMDPVPLTSISGKAIPLAEDHMVASAVAGSSPCSLSLSPSASRGARAPCVQSCTHQALVDLECFQTIVHQSLFQCGALVDAQFVIVSCVCWGCARVSGGASHN